MGEIDTAEGCMEDLSKIEYEGKGDKEELEKLLLFVTIFIARKDFTIAKYSLESIITNNELDKMLEYKALFLYQRVCIHCIESEAENVTALIESIQELVKDKQNIMFHSHLNYLNAWAYIQLDRTDDARAILHRSFLRTKGRLLNAGMFFLPKDILSFFRKEQLSFKEKQQS